MVHQWKDVGRGKLDRVSTVNITDTYREVLGANERINGMGAFCDGNDCGPAGSGAYIIHRPPCMALASSRTDEENEMYDEDCG